MAGHYADDPQITVRRSWLLAPMSDAELTAEAWTLGADVLALDLMELVADEDKPAARERAREAIAGAGRGGSHVFAQVDKELLYADLDACVWPGLNGIIIPRLESAQEVEEADDLLSGLEEARGIPPNTLQIVASVETAKGNLRAMDIALSSRRLWGMTLGRVDLVMDLRPEPSGEIHLLPYLMQRIITVANAAGLVPIGAWWRAPARGLLASPDHTYKAALRGRKIGFKGSLCIRPDQVKPLNRGFTPESAEVAEAEQIVLDFGRAEMEGRGVAQLEDRIIDQPTSKAAGHQIAYARACAARDQEKVQAMARSTQDISDQGNAT